jgi:hypothetical protein
MIEIIKTTTPSTQRDETSPAYIAGALLSGFAMTRATKVA